MKSTIMDDGMFSQLDNPVVKLMELNMRTLQNMAYIKPADLSGLKRPEDVLTLQMSILAQNSHMALNYLRDSLFILEHHLMSMASHAGKQTLKSAAVAKKSTKKAATTSKSVAKKSVAALKTATKGKVKKVRAKTASPMMGKKGTVKDIGVVHQRMGMPG